MAPHSTGKRQGGSTEAWARGSALMVALVLTPGCLAGCPLLGGQQRTMECAPTRQAPPDTQTGQATCSPLPEFGLSCMERFVQPGNLSDIIWVVDNSGSMGEEIADIRRHINSFAAQVTQSGLDAHIVMISDKGTTGASICVAEPLASPNCGDNGQFRHVDEEVASTDAPNVMLDSYGAYEAMLRDGSHRAVVFVTDDNSRMSGETFVASMNAKARLAGAAVHGVVGLDLNDCPDIAAKGSNYERMAQLTGGLVVPICCNDYGLLVDTLATDIAQASRRFRLDREVTSPQSVRVFIEDQLGLRTPVTSGFTFDEALRAVVFDEGAQPPAGSIVVITYGSR